MRGVNAPQRPPATPGRPARKHAKAFAALVSRPLRNVLRWQALATVACVAIAVAWRGGDAGWSAALGGGVTMLSTLAYAVVLDIGDTASAGASVATMLRAEAVKIVVIMIGLWLALTRWHGIVPGALLAAFVITVLLFSVALLTRNPRT